MNILLKQSLLVWNLGRLVKRRICAVFHLPHRVDSPSVREKTHGRAGVGYSELELPLELVWRW
jgi:hypothetical protein